NVQLSFLVRGAWGGCRVGDGEEDAADFRVEEAVGATGAVLACSIRRGKLHPPAPHPRPFSRADVPIHAPISWAAAERRLGSVPLALGLRAIHCVGLGGRKFNSRVSGLCPQSRGLAEPD